MDRLQKELGVDGVYIDQISAAAPEPCWNENHPHPVGGGDFWYDGYRRLIGKIRSNYLQEGKILTSEENSECYLDLFDMQLVVNTPHNATDCRIRPVFPMVYSDRVITSGFTYSPLSVEGMTDGDFRYEIAKALLWGSQPGWVDPRYLMAEEAAVEARFLKTLMDFRRGLHDVIYGGRFIREMAAEGDNPLLHAPGFGDEAAVLASGVGNARRQARLHRREPRREGPQGLAAGCQALPHRGPLGQAHRPLTGGKTGKGPNRDRTERRRDRTDRQKKAKLN